MTCNLRHPMGLHHPACMIILNRMVWNIYTGRQRKHVTKSFSPMNLFSNTNSFSHTNSQELILSHNTFSHTDSFSHMNSFSHTNSCLVRAHDLPRTFAFPTSTYLGVRHDVSIQGYIWQKRRIILWSLLIVATPYLLCMGWLRLVGSLKLQVSFAEYSLFFYRALLRLLQKKPMI